MKKDHVIRLASDCWNAFEKRGGLDIKRYDAPLVDNLRKLLGFQGDAPIDKQLLQAGTSTEDFIGAFIKTIAPYGMMMQELLRFFNKAAAQRSSSGTLRISFDFHQASQSFSFNLENFREWEKKIIQIQSDTTCQVWSYDSLIQLRNLLEEVSTSHTSSFGGKSKNPFKIWLSDYQKKNKWLIPVPDKPVIQSLDSMIFDEIWDIWRKIVIASAKESMSREDLKRLMWKPDDPEIEPGITLWNLRNLDERNWAGDVAQALSILTTVQTIDAPLSNKISQLINARPIARMTMLQQEEILEELLSLPVWKHRHDLYAAWVGARIVQSLEDISTVHSANGMLRYAFSGSHLATMQGANGIQAFLWAELRTPLTAPVGKSRIKGIQPDYSLQLEPVTYPERCILVVECKQYLKVARKSFIDTLRDYLRGRKNATVILVNYGPANPNLIRDLDAADHSRVQIIGDFRPDCPERLTQFSLIVRKAASCLLEPDEDSQLAETPSEPQYAPTSGFKAPVQSEQVEPLARISLTWGATPLDLDLHIWTRYDNQPWEHVNYKAMGTLQSFPWAQLHEDHKQGNGNEVVEVLHSRELWCAVHNYSRDSPLSNSHCRLLIKLENLSLELECPVLGDGAWWQAFHYDFKTQYWSVPGRITVSAPNPTLGLNAE